jgi:hypothetical protein
MGEECGNGAYEKCVQYFGWKHSEVLNVAGRRILRRIAGRLSGWGCGLDWTGLMLFFFWVFVPFRIVG